MICCEGCEAVRAMKLFVTVAALRMTPMRLLAVGASFFPVAGYRSRDEGLPFLGPPIQRGDQKGESSQWKYLYIGSHAPDQRVWYGMVCGTVVRRPERLHKRSQRTMLSGAEEFTPTRKEKGLFSTLWKRKRPLYLCIIYNTSSSSIHH